MAALPLNHYRHLARLANLRRITIGEATDFLVANVDPNSENWIDEHFGFIDEEREIDLRGHDPDSVIKKIQGLPRSIRPVTDGPYLEQFRFFAENAGLIGIEAEGIKMLDFEMASSRDKEVFRLVKDLLPPMSEQEYRVYNTFNSQYLRLVREPNLFTMPRIKAMAIDAGCYVGYKAMAMAQFVGDNPVLAFELASDNIEVLKKNIANNPSFRIEAIRAALSDSSEDLTIHTRNERTMAHSLTSFTELKEANTGLLASGQVNTEGETVRTTLLDDYTKDVDELSAVHVSVNGHEPEVVNGGIMTAQKADILRVSCPYSRSGRPIREMVIESFTKNGVEVFGISGAAVVAGKKLGEYHAVPFNAQTSSKPEKEQARSFAGMIKRRFFTKRT